MSVLAVLALVAAPLLGSGTAARPNLVVIVCDQAPAWAVDPATRAPLDLPALDSLAARGTTFTRAYATSPVCAANRLALLTGRYPFTLGTDKLQPGVQTLGSILLEQGYATGYVGKWHLSENPIPSQYVRPGLRSEWEFFSGKEGGTHFMVTGSSFRQNDPTPIPSGPWEPAWNRAEAVQFLRTERDRPFVLVLNIDIPHGNKDHALMPPLTITSSQVIVRPSVLKAEKLAAKPRYARTLSEMVLMDVEVAALLAEVDLTTTFVVFTTDHGDLLRSHGAANNQQKRSPYEEAAHVPFILAGPGVAAGASDARLMSTVDLLPSLLSLLEVPIPPAIQGTSFPSEAAVYLGQDDGKSAWLGERWRALVHNQLKYAVSEGGTELLFDLVADPYERSNLVRDPTALPTLQSMRRALRERAHDLRDPFFP